MIINNNKNKNKSKSCDNLTEINDDVIESDKLDLNNKKDNISDQRIECVICFDNESIPNLKEINEINFIEKICACNFKIHELCLKKWIINKPACPYCHEVIIIKNRPFQSSLSSNMYNALDTSIEEEEENNIQEIRGQFGLNLNRNQYRNSCYNSVTTFFKKHSFTIFCIFMIVFIFFFLIYPQ